MTTVLVLVKYYLPGYKSGGPLRTVANIVDHLGDEFTFIVLTWDRDSGDPQPYPGIRSGDRRRVGKADVIYVAPAALTARRMSQIIGSIRPDVLYVNSFFSREFGVRPALIRRFGMVPHIPTILAPRGEFSTGALALKSRKKQAFLLLSNRLRLHRGITWQASSSLEAAEIQRCIATTRVSAPADPVVIAPDLQPATLPPADGLRRAKRAGSLRVLFLSRLAPKKNLRGALEILRSVTGDIEFNIFGPIEDAAYWAECESLARSLPPNIRARYAGLADHSEVASIMAEHDVLFFPTHGENYGHVIIEALLGGCPVLISDQTPWRQLEAAGVGWDVPLTQPQAFRTVLETCVGMDSATFAAWSSRARAYAWRHASDPTVVDATRALLRDVGQRRGPGSALAA